MIHRGISYIKANTLLGVENAEHRKNFRYTATVSL